MPDNGRSEKLTWAFSSGELKKLNVCQYYGLKLMWSGIRVYEWNP
jgi:hypothetical protein